MLTTSFGSRRYDGLRLWRLSFTRTPDALLEHHQPRACSFSNMNAMCPAQVLDRCCFPFKDTTFLYPRHEINCQIRCSSITRTPYKMCHFVIEVQSRMFQASILDQWTNLFLVLMAAFFAAGEWSHGLIRTHFGHDPV